MSVLDALALSFVALAVIAVAVSAIGVAVMTDVFDRMHYIGPASMIAPVAIAAAVIVREGLSSAGIKALLVAVVISSSAPVLTHATGRAARIRQLGHWRATDQERIEGS